MNAVILAAGMGSRLRPLTDDTPKALVKVNGQAIIERQIESLKEIGIDEIIIATGYLHKSFNYLKEKYGVKLVYNDKYDVYNNGYTMYLVREHLKDTLVLEGDVYLRNNFLVSDLRQSTYFTGKKNKFTDEWVLKFNANHDVTDIVIGSGSDYIMTGVSYWNAADGRKIKTMLEEMVREKGFDDFFWDHLIKDQIKDFKLKVHKIKSEDWVEIDSLSDLQRAETS